jgi:hypothetical protein
VAFTLYMSARAHLKAPQVKVVLFLSRRALCGSGRPEPVQQWPQVVGRPGAQPIELIGIRLVPLLPVGENTGCVLVEDDLGGQARREKKEADIAVRCSRRHSRREVVRVCDYPGLFGQLGRGVASQGIESEFFSRRRRLEVAAGQLNQAGAAGRCRHLANEQATV